nr:hypothetical protein GCM10020093_046650 [Planobispora longispora]
MVLPNQPGFDWDRVRAIPGVIAVGTFPVSGFHVEDLPGGPLPVWIPGPSDTEMWHTIERPVLLAGRLPAPGRADEIAVSARFADAYGRGPGDTLALRLASAEQLRSVPDAAFAVPQGPRITVRITGIVRSPWFRDHIGQGGVPFVSAALFQRYRANFMGSGREQLFVNALVRLAGGTDARSLSRFKEDLARVTGRSDIDVWNAAEDVRHIGEVLDYEALSLLAFGLAALAAATVLTGQSIARYCWAAAAELQVLRAVGLVRRQAVAAAALPVLAAVAAGAALGLAGAVAASHWTPIGIAADLEPAPGLDADWWVLAPGALLAVALGALGAAVSTWRALRGPRPADIRPSAVATAAARAACRCRPCWAPASPWNAAGARSRCVPRCWERWWACSACWPASLSPPASRRPRAIPSGSARPTSSKP